MSEAKNFDTEQSRTDRMLYIIHKKVLSFQEACLYLDCKDTHLYRLTSTRSIPHYSPSGKLIYFNREEIEEWVFSKKRCTKEELKQELVYTQKQNTYRKRA